MLGPYVHPTATECFLEERSHKIRTVSSRKSYNDVLAHLQRLHPGKRVNTFTEAELVAFVVRGKPSKNTMASRLTVLGSFYRWAYLRKDWTHLSVNPAANLRMLVELPDGKRLVQPRHWLTATQFAVVMRSCGDDVEGMRDRTVLMLGVFTGMRRAEISRLRWDGVDIEGGTIRYLSKKEKIRLVGIPAQLGVQLEKWRIEYETGLGKAVTNEPVIVPVYRPRITVGYNGRAVPAEAYTSAKWGRCLRPNSINSLMQRVAERTSLPGFSTHDLRRTLAGLLEAAGKHIEEISAALGHDDIGTTQRYMEDNPMRGIKATAGFTIAGV